MEKYIGLAIRANACVFGTDNILSCKKKQYVIVLDTTLSQNAKNKLVAFAQKHSCEIKEVGLLEEMVHKPGVKAISITNENLAKQITK